MDEKRKKEIEIIDDIVKKEGILAFDIAVEWIFENGRQAYVEATRTEREQEIETLFKGDNTLIFDKSFLYSVLGVVYTLATYVSFDAIITYIRLYTGSLENRDEITKDRYYEMLGAIINGDGYADPLTYDALNRLGFTDNEICLLGFESLLNEEERYND